MIAALLGAGPVADAFLAAFQLVNVVRRLLTEGGLNAALVPAWLRVRDTEGAVAAAAFAGRVLGTVTAALFAGALLLAVLMPFVMHGAGAGISRASETLQLAVDDARLMLPYLAFAGPVTVMMALLNAQGRFALTAFSPLLFNIALIAVMIVLMVLAAGCRACRADPCRHRRHRRPAAALDPGAAPRRRHRNAAAGFVRHRKYAAFSAKAVPGMIASSTPQLLVVAGAIIASSSPSSVSWLYFANRLVELPLGIVGVAMGTVLIPEMTRALRSDDPAAVAHAESRGLELAVGLALPATLGLILLSEPVVRMLFEHGAFTATDTAATAHALMWLALGLPANVLVKALSPAFFAREDTLTPLVATLKGVAFALVLAVLLGHWFGASGVAAAIALGAWSTALTLIRRGRRDLRLLDRRRRAAAAARHPRGRAGHGRGLCGSRLRWLTPALAASSHRPAAGDRPAHPDYRRDCDLRPVSAAFRHHRLARSG